MVWISGVSEEVVCIRGDSVVQHTALNQHYSNIATLNCRVNREKSQDKVDWKKERF